MADPSLMLPESKYTITAGTFTVAFAVVSWSVWETGSQSEVDAWTMGALALVTAVFALYLWASWRWERSALPVPVEVDAAAVLQVNTQAHLPVGESENIVATAMRNVSAPGWLATGANTLISLGLAGTFFGLTMGLFEAVPCLASDATTATCPGLAGALGSGSADGLATGDAVEVAISALLDGAMLAFLKSLLGIVLATLWSFRHLEVKERESAISHALLVELNQRLPPMSMEQLTIQMARQAQESAKALDGRITAMQGQNADGQPVTLSHLATTIRALRGADSAGSDVNLATLAAGLQAVQKSTRALRGTDESGKSVNLATLAVGIKGIQKSTADLRGADDEAGEVNLATLAAGLRAIDKTTAALRGTDGEDVEVNLAMLAAGLQEINSSTAALSGAMNSLAEELPEKLAGPIGVQVCAVVAPALATLNGTMEQLSSTGASAFGEAITSRVGNELSGFQSALAEINIALQTMPKTLSQGSTEAVKGLQRSTEENAKALTGAANAVAAQNTESAATIKELTAVAAELQRSLLDLRGQGAEFGEALSDATVPLRDLPESLSAVKDGISATGRALRHDVVNQLDQWQASLALQTQAQQELTRTATEQQAKFIETNAALQATTAQSATLLQSIDDLRGACLSTVEALQEASAAQATGTTNTVDMLLEAVNQFNSSLEKSQSTLHEASTRAVASTEQVTIAAAREVAAALKEGANALTSAMSRAESVGQRLDEHGVALRQNVDAASIAAQGMVAHATTLTTSGKAIATSMQAAAVPLNAANQALQAVPDSIANAADALRSERKALSGLGDSLQRQAELVREQERTLTARTTELEALHEVLGDQWAGNVGRLVDAHTKVKEAWQVAMASASSGHEDQARRIGDYAKQVEKALGLKADVSGLRETLEELAGTLADLQSIGPGMDALSGSVQALNTTLGHRSPPSPRTSRA